MRFASSTLGLLAFLLPAYALTNVTVDDTDGDEVTGGQITYSPSSSWKAGQDCTDCTATIQANQTYDGSWHDGTYYPVGASGATNPGDILTVQYTFTGQAIYVYCVIARTSSSPDGNTDMTFYIDGVESGTYELAPDNDTTIYYDQLVYSNTGLTEGEHNFTIANGLANQKSLVLLDRLVYSTDNATNTTSSSATSSSSTSSSSSSSTSSSSSKSSSSTSKTTSSTTTTTLAFTSAATSATSTSGASASGAGRSSIISAAVLGGLTLSAAVALGL